jgi:hypothetical protein
MDLSPYRVRWIHKRSCSDLIVEIVVEHPLKLREHTKKGESGSTDLKL